MKWKQTHKTCGNPVLWKREYKFVDFLLTDARIIPVSFNLDKLFWTLLLTTVVVDLIGYSSVMIVSHYNPVGTSRRSLYLFSRLWQGGKTNLC